MKIFELVEDQPIITTEGIMLFKELYDRDKEKGKDRFFQEMQYVYFLTDYKSLYYSYPEETREQKVIEDFIKIKNWKPDNLVKAAVVKYNELQNTESLRFLQSARNAMNKLSEYWNTLDVNERNNKGDKVFKPTDVSRSIADSSKMIESLDKIIEKVRKEEDYMNRTRGGGEGGFFEDK